MTLPISAFSTNALTTGIKTAGGSVDAEKLKKSQESKLFKKLQL